MKHVKAYAFQPGIPPKEIQLWNPGANPTDYGIHLWTERSAREVFASYSARGNPLQIDVEHNNADDEVAAELGPQGGYARLEIRDGAPWLVFDWSAYSVEQISTKQRCFISPEYLVDKNTNEITRLVRVSLVANPGTHHARMLASAKHLGAESKSMDLATLIAALKAALSTDDADAAKQQIANLLSEIEGMGGSGGDGGATEETAAADTEEQKTAADAGGDPPADDPSKKKDAPVAASAPKKRSVAASEIALAQRVAELEAREAVRASTTSKLEAQLRVAAAGARIPESLHAFALKLSKDDFDTFLAGLPQATAGQSGIRAAARPANGEERVTGETSSELPADAQRSLARAFRETDRPTESVIRVGHQVKLTHMSKPKKAGV